MLHPKKVGTLPVAGGDNTKQTNEIGMCIYLVADAWFRTKATVRTATSLELIAVLRMKKNKTLEVYSLRWGLDITSYLCDYSRRLPVEFDVWR